MDKELNSEWYWSEKNCKWVFLEIDGREKRFIMRDEPPPEFIKLTDRMKQLTIKIANADDPAENLRLYDELKKISERLNRMKRIEEY